MDYMTDSILSMIQFTQVNCTCDQNSEAFCYCYLKSSYHFKNLFFIEMFQTYFPEAYANIAKDDFAGDFLLLAYRKPTHDRNLAVSFIEAWNQAGQDKYDLESFPLPVGNVTVLDEDKALDEFMRSDHVALWRDNIPAIYISDSGIK